MSVVQQQSSDLRPLYFVKIAHIQYSFAIENGGPTQSLSNYCRGQVAAGHEVSVWTLEGFPQWPSSIRLPPPVEMNVFQVESPTKLGRSAEMRRQLRLAEAPDIYHLHGVWLQAMRYGAVEARRRNRPYVLELAGMYEPLGLRQKWLPKRIARWWFQDRILREAACLHVNSPQEAENIRKLGFKTPIAVIPVGVDLQQIEKQKAEILKAENKNEGTNSTPHPKTTSSDLRPPSPQSGEGNLPGRGGEGVESGPVKWQTEDFTGQGKQPDEIGGQRFHGPGESEIHSRLLHELQGRPFILYLSRIHPKKGLDLLIRAWARVQRPEGGGQRAEGGKQKAEMGNTSPRPSPQSGEGEAEIGNRKAEGNIQHSTFNIQHPTFSEQTQEAGGQKPEDGSQRSEVRRPSSAVSRQPSAVRDQYSAPTSDFRPPTSETSRPSSDWVLVIAGSGERPYVEKCRRLAADLGIAKQCLWLGHVDEVQKSWLFAHAHCYVLPTSGENFGNTVAEALAHGTPVITTRHTPWRDLEEHGCGWFVNNTETEIGRALHEALNLDAIARGRMGDAGERLVRDRYSLQAVLNDINAVYEWLLGGAPIPACVQLEPEDGGRRAEGLKAEILKAESRNQMVEGNIQHPTSSDQTAEGGGRLPAPASSVASGPARRELPARSEAYSPEGKAETVSGLLTSAAAFQTSIEQSREVKVLFDQKAATWSKKYGVNGVLRPRLYAFEERLRELVRPPATVLDFGCGTGNLAGHLTACGYAVSACDISSKMVEWARKNNHGASVAWHDLPAEWRELPFASNSFDAIVASSVFEYLTNLEMTLAECWRVLKPGGCLLATVPNNRHSVRKLEALLHPMVTTANRLSVLNRIQKLHSYGTYLHCSRNRMPLDEWFSIGNQMRFTAVEQDKSRASHAALVFLVFRKTDSLS